MIIAVNSASMLAIVAALTGAQVQRNDDVVIMRRPIAEPRGVRPTPTPQVPTPTPATPTPAPGGEEPVPTPTPVVPSTPIPSPTPPVDAEWRATTLKAERLSSTSATTLPVTVGGEACFVVGSGEAVDAAACQGKPRDPLIGSRILTAVTSSALKTTFVDVEDLAALMPRLANLDAFCSSSATLSGSLSKYSVRCDSNPGSLQYARLMKTVSINSGTLNTGTVRVTGRTYACVDVSTGAEVDIPGCSSVPLQPGFDIPAQFSEPLRTLAIDAEDLQARLPIATNVEALCATTASISLPTGSSTYKVRCDPAEIEMHYEKVPTTAAAVTQTYPFDGGYQISTQSSGVRCHDTRTDQDAADQSKCAWLPNPANVGILAFPERSKPENKTVVVDKAQILAQAPKLSNLDTFCLSSATVRLNGANQTWRVRCDPAELDVAYESYVKSLLPVSTTTTTTANARLRQPEDLPGYLLFRVPNDNSTGCRDLASGAVVSTTLCANLPIVYKGGDHVSIDVVGQSRLLQTVVVSTASAEAVSPEVVTSACRGTVNLWQGLSYKEYTISCNPDDLVEKYEQRNFVLAVPNSSTYYTRSTESNVNLRVLSYGCFDVSTNPATLLSTRDRCQYYPGPQVGDHHPFQAIYRDDLRTVYVDRKAIADAYPMGVNVDAVCQLNTYRVRTGTATNSTTFDEWKLRCDRSEIEGEYVRYASNIYTPHISTRYPRNPFTEIQLRVFETTCYDKRTGQLAADQSKCDYTAEGPVYNDYFTVPAGMVEADKRVFISRADILARNPKANLDYLCTGSKSVRVLRPGNSTSVDDWRITCQ